MNARRKPSFAPAVTRPRSSGTQIGLAGLDVDDDGDPDCCHVCSTRTGRFTTVVVHGRHKVICRSCAQTGGAPTLVPGS